MNNKILILASCSPRRSLILSNMGLKFVVKPSGYEEKLSDLNFSYEKIENLAYQKAKKLLEDDPTLNNSIILSADTVVVLDNKILGKPKDKDDAFKILKKLSAKTHFVVTGMCTIDADTKEKKLLSTTSYVTFNELSNELINYYINEFKPFDKAGAYGIQELPDGFIKNTKGSFENIVGLCPNAVEKILN